MILRRKIYYCTGFISILLLFPSLYIYLSYNVTIDKSRCIILQLYQEDPDPGCFPVPAKVYEADLRDNGSLNFTALYKLKKELKDSQRPGIIKLPELKSYGEFISIINIFIEYKPQIIYSPEHHIFIISTRLKINSEEDLEKYSLVFNPDKFYLFDRKGIHINHFFSSIDFWDTTDFFLITAWIILAAFSMLSHIKNIGAGRKIARRKAE